MDQLCLAVTGVDASTTADPAKKRCVKDAKAAMEKALAGLPQGKDDQGAEKPPKEIVLVDNTNTEWANDKSPHAYTVPETMRLINGKKAAVSTPAVGEGSERVVLPYTAFGMPPWALAPVLAHEGKRLIQFSIIADADNPTDAELKRKECNEEEAYGTNLLVTIELIKRLRAMWDAATPGGTLRNFLNKEIENMEKYKAFVEGEMQKAKEKKEKLGG